MSSGARIKKHPIHAMLIPFPIALWIFSLVADLFYVLGLGGFIWKDIAFYALVGGLIGGLAAAIPGYLDYRSLTDKATMRLGWWHLMVNLTVVGLSALNVLLRWNEGHDAAVPVFLSVIAVGMLAVSGWLGGEMVYVHGAGVERPRVKTEPETEKPRRKAAGGLP